MTYTILLLGISIPRYIINNRIYRSEYDYYEYSDGVATSFNSREVEKRDNAVILAVLCLFTFVWIKYSKKENRKRVVWSHVLSILFFATLGILLLIS